MQPDDYDYSKAGFDGFLSRSIDDLSQANLDSLGPPSTAQAYDRSQVSGSLGDTLQVGNVHINRTNIIVSDGVNDFVLIGQDV